jgi:hypothetical protein
MDWIQGQKFWKIADMVFTPKVFTSDDYYKLPNTYNETELVEGTIIYTHTMYVKELFQNMNDYLMPDFVIVISHNSDVNVDESFRVPACVKKWFTTNVNVINPKIVSIPIGLENDRWFPKEHKKDQMEWRLGQKRENRNLVYMNFDIRTNPNKRQEPYDILKNKSWVTTECKSKNGVGFNHYIQNIFEHKFVVCPEGNGIDTHRFWETLYMGSIPIVKENINYAFYSKIYGLPILMVKDWKDLTKENLEYVYGESSTVQWDFNMLTFEYWKNIILNERN